MRAVVAAALAPAAAGMLATAALSWGSGAALPDPRSEVAAAILGSQIAVVGGFEADGGTSARVDLYSPTADRWRRLPDLPVPANHAAAAGAAGRIYVVGGYTTGLGNRLRRAFVFERGRWRDLPRPPYERAAAGAVIAARNLYVVGGVGPVGLARNMLVFDVARRRWGVLPGPTPREHLAVTAAGGRVYALGGRTAGFDTNVSTFEVYEPSRRRWRRLPPVPSPRGGTGAAGTAGMIVSAGGEEPGGTIASVYGFDLARRVWRRLPDLPTPRHGVGVAAIGRRVYVIAGGTEPGLAVSGVNEYLDLG
jgi:N-acetylneuraminic acid mutarotase